MPALGRLQSSSLERNQRHLQSMAAQPASVPLRSLGRAAHTNHPICSSRVKAAKPGPNKQARNGFDLCCFPPEPSLNPPLRKTHRQDGEYHPIHRDLHGSVRAVLSLTLGTQRRART